MMSGSFMSRYMEGIIEPLFKTDALGRTVFYPFGVFGRGRIVPDAAAAEGLRGRLRRFQWVLVIGVPAVWIAAIIGLVWWISMRPDHSADAALRDTMVVMGLFDTLLGLVALITGLILFGMFLNLWMCWPALGLPRSDERLRFRDVWQAQAVRLGRGWLVALLAISLLNAARIAHDLMSSNAPPYWLGGFSLVFWLALTVIFAMQLRWVRAKPRGGEAST
ncbi:MAG: hypothetical protein AB7E70_07805 [Hyphomicrobiaceae bacterium]